MADDEPTTNPPAEEADEKDDDAHDPSPSEAANLALADAVDAAQQAANAISSLSVNADDAPTAAQQAPSAPAAVPAQQLPLNLPMNLAALDDADAAALDNEFLSLLPPCILPRISKLKDLNNKRDALLEDYRIARAALELKFSALMEPLYEERRGVVNGEFDEDIIKEDGEDKEDSEEVIAEEGVVEDVNEDDGDHQQPFAAIVAGNQGGQDVKGIPQFWACAMGHVDVIAELITEADVDCLDHLTNVTSTDFPDGLGFDLTFHFSPNPFFTNTTLTKRYEVPNLLTEDEPILKNVTGTPIQWKKDQSLTYKEVTKKQRKKGGPNAGQLRTVTKKERCDSFFHFFTPPKMPGLMEVMDEEEADAVEEAFDHDYDVAQAFRGHLVPKAVLWFTGEAMMMDDLSEGEMEGMMEGNAAQQQQQFTFNPNGGTGPFPPPAAGEGDQQECKQN